MIMTKMWDEALSGGKQKMDSMMMQKTWPTLQLTNIMTKRSLTLTEVICSGLAVFGARECSPNFQDEQSDGVPEDVVIVLESTKRVGMESNHQDEYEVEQTKSDPKRR